MNNYHFDDKKHAHTLNGKPLHGVTTILKYWGDPNPLLNWGVKTAVDYIEKDCEQYQLQGKAIDQSELIAIRKSSLQEARTAHLRKRDKAGDKGTEIHNCLEDLLNIWMNEGKAPNTKVEVAGAVINWMESQKITPLASEMNVYSESMWLGGIIDAVIEKDGKKYILDFKTSGTVQTKYFYQLAAYAAMYEETTGEKIEGGCIVHIPRGQSFNPEKNVYWRYDIEALKQAFMGILNAYKLDQDLQKLIKY